MAKIADIYFKVDPWKIIEEGFNPDYARVSESIFSLGNESIGVRGFLRKAAARTASGDLTATAYTIWSIWAAPIGALWMLPTL